jgi:hypothetical protein
MSSARPREVELQPLIPDVAMGTGAMISDAIVHLEKSLDALRALRNKLIHSFSDTSGRSSRKRMRRR